MKTTKLDEKIFRYIEENVSKLIVVLMILVAMIIRALFIRFTEMSSDYVTCIYPWWMEYKEYGIIGGLGRTIGNYYVPYNLIVAFASLFPMQPCYIIAAFSILGDLLCALFVYKILQSDMIRGFISKEKAAIISAGVLYIPCVLLNGSLWKQCDSIYSAFAIMSLYFAISEKYNKMVVFWTISFVFKLQAVFILPLLFMVYLIKKKFSLLTFIWIPIIYFVAGLPAIICGRGLLETYGVYFGQTGQGSSMMTNTTNIYEFGFSDPDMCSKPAVLITFIALIMMIYVCYKNADKIDDQKLVMVAAWITWTCYMFLPRMRQRYDFIAIVLLTVYLAAFEFDKMWMAYIVNIVSLSQYSRYLFKLEMSVIWLTIPNVLMYIIFTGMVLNRVTRESL